MLKGLASLHLIRLATGFRKLKVHPSVRGVSAVDSTQSIRYQLWYGDEFYAVLCWSRGA